MTLFCPTLWAWKLLEPDDGWFPPFRDPVKICPNESPMEARWNWLSFSSRGHAQHLGCARAPQCACSAIKVDPVTQLCVTGACTLSSNMELETAEFERLVCHVYHVCLCLIIPCLSFYPSLEVPFPLQDQSSYPKLIQKIIDPYWPPFCQG